MSRRQGPQGQNAPPLNEQSLQALVETIPALVWRARPDGHIDYVNKRLLDYLGSPLEEIIGWGWMKKVHPHDVAFKVQSWLKHLGATSSHDTNCRFQGSDGVYRRFNVRGEPLLDGDGQVQNWYGLLIDIDDRMKAEETYRESEYKLRQIIETVPAFLWSTAPDGEPTHISQRILDYSGMRFENFQHDGWEAFMHPADFPETAKAFNHAIQTGAPYEGVHRLRRAADGEYLWHHARGEPLRDRQGRIVQWYGLSIDIDERKKAEERLRRSEGYLADAQRLSRTGTLVLNAKTWQYVYLSDESYRIWGLDPLQGFPSHETITQRFHPDDRDGVWQKVREALRQKKDYSGEFRIVLPDETIKCLAVTAHHLFSTSGELVEVIATSVDVTDQKRAEEALRESERRSRSALDGIAGLVAVLAPNGEVETVNRQLSEYFGRSLYWLKSWTTNDAVHPQDRSGVLESFKRGMTSGLAFNEELRIRRFDGEYRWFDFRAVPIRDDPGCVARWYVLLTDIEDRTKALARLEEMQSDLAHTNRVSMMGELAASLSHEITQPIASARNNASAALNFLDKKPPDFGEVKEALSCIVGDTDRARSIVDRIRDHMRKAPPRKERFDLNEALNEVIALGRSAIIKNGVSVQTRLSDGLFPIHGDRVQLQQVVLNLILNAVEAMGSIEDETRELSITTKQDEASGVVVTVGNSGPGIDPKHLDHVFDAFYTTKPSGVGMGLSICRSIIDAHGGRLWADVNTPRGALFRFTLPNEPSS